MCKLLTQGTNKYQAKEIADFFENKGCIVDTLSGESTFGLSLSFFQQDQKEIYDMVSHLLQASTFSTTELALKKQQLLNDFLVEKRIYLGGTHQRFLE